MAGDWIKLADELKEEKSDLLIAEGMSFKSKFYDLKYNKPKNHC